MDEVCEIKRFERKDLERRITPGRNEGDSSLHTRGAFPVRQPVRKCYHGTNTQGNYVRFVNLHRYRVHYLI